jgi:predicted nucleic acid-binding protein
LVTAFIDTAVPMYAAGADHPLREPCVRILELIRRGDLDGVTSTEVVQEITHRFLAVRRPEFAKQLAIDVLDLFAPVLPITHALMRRVPELGLKYPALQARDLTHVATCIHEGITDIISPDRAFDQVHEIRRIDPAEFADERA